MHDVVRALHPVGVVALRHARLRVINGGVVDLKANRIVIDSGTEVKKGTTLNVINR